MSHGDSVAGSAARVRASSARRRHADRRLRGRRARLYGCSSIPRCGTRRTARQILENFLFRRLRRQARVDDGVLPTREGRGDPRAGARRAPSSARSRAAWIPRSTALLLREALGDRVHPILVDHGLLRAREREQVVEAFAPPRHPRPRGRRRRSCSSRAGRRHRSRGEAQDHRAHVHRRLRDGSRRRFRTRASSRRGRSTPTSSSRSRSRGPRRSSRRTTTSAACRSAWASSSSSPCASSSRTRSALLGAELGLPREFLARHPFPGPGLAVRMPGEVTRERVALLQKADEIVLEEIRTAGLYDAISQAFAVLLPVRSVGVMGDGRTHEYVLAVRAVQTTDFMTADWFRMPHEVLDAIATRIDQRGPRDQPRRLRHHVEAAGDDRVGVSANEEGPLATGPSISNPVEALLRGAVARPASPACMPRARHRPRWPCP